MNNTYNLRRYRYIGVLIFISLVISISIVLSKHYPLEETRDWLSILSDFGQAFGMLAIVSLIIELVQREFEVTEKRKPRIQIDSIVMVNKLPDGKPNCLCEKMQAELPTKEVVSKDDDYREMYISMGRPNSATDRYFRIGIKNNQTHYEGSARDLQIYIRFDYAMEDESQKVETRKIWGPRKGFSLSSGDVEYLFVRCGKVQDDAYTKVSGQVLDFKCINLLGDKFAPKNVPDFEQIEIPEQPLYRALDEE